MVEVELVRPEAQELMVAIINETEAKNSQRIRWPRQSARLKSLWRIDDRRLGIIGPWPYADEVVKKFPGVLSAKLV